jgi:DNA-binding MarR family transcriptional regulator
MGRRAAPSCHSEVELVKKNAPLTRAEFQARSEFRHHLRRFLRFSETAAKQHGITPAQYQLLLHIKGHPERPWALIGELAERMLLEQHSMVGLVSRSEAAGLVKRRPGAQDRRQVQVHLTAAGERAAQAIAAMHEEELASLLSALRRAGLK